MPETKPGAQMRITPQELSILKNTFRGNEELVRLMRKLFLPELDPYAPLGQNFDLYMTLKIEDLDPEVALINLKARNTLIAHLDQCLLQIRTLAELPEEQEGRNKKNSSK